jgi:hypothetical protein
VVPFLDGKKEKIEGNSVKRSILTTFGAAKAQKRDFSHFLAVLSDCFT